MTPGLRAIAVCALSLCLLVPSTLLAQPPVQPPATTTEDSFEQLKSKLRQIEEQHRRELSDLKERLGLVEKQQSTLSDELTQRIKVGAYGAVWYQDFKGQRSTNDGNFEMLMSGHIHDRIRIYTEIDLGIPSGEATAEQAYVDLLLTQPFNLRAGVLLIPFGKFNLDHFDPRRDLTRPPAVATVVIPTTWGDLGFGSFGLLPISDNVKATYDIQVINGLTDQFASDPYEHRAAAREETVCTLTTTATRRSSAAGPSNSSTSTKLDFQDTAGAYKPSGSDMITGMALDGEFRPRNVSILENFVLRGEFARFDIEGSTAPSSLWGYYAQLTYRFWFSGLNSTVLGRQFNNPTFALVGLIGHTKTNTTASPTGSLSGDQYIIGFNYRPVEDYVIKAEYQFNHGQYQQNPYDGFLTSVAWIF